MSSWESTIPTSAWSSDSRTKKVISTVRGGLPPGRSVAGWLAGRLGDLEHEVGGPRPDDEHRGDHGHGGEDAEQRRADADPGPAPPRHG